MNITPFIQSLEKVLNDYKTKNGYTYFERYEVIAMEANRYFKVYRREICKEGTPLHDSIVCFIDKQTGDIFKPASWKAPAKHARGNVLSPQNGMEAIDEHGFVRYLRG